MTKRWLHIRDDVIENISLGADEQPADADGVIFVEDFGGVGPGYRLVGNQWVPPPPPVPEEVTLSDWRVALIRMGRFDDVRIAAEQARDHGGAEGQIAYTRFEYANHVYRSELHQMAPAFGFTPEEADISLLVANGVDPASLVQEPAIDPSANRQSTRKRAANKRSAKKR